jgi:hypothetical protein
MKLSLNKRQMTLGSLLSLTLVAVVVAYFHDEDSPEVVQPVAKGREASVLTAPVAIPAGMVDSLNITGLRQNMLGVDQHAGQVFASKSWYVPPHRRLVLHRRLPRRRPCRSLTWAVSRRVVTRQ